MQAAKVGGAVVVVRPELSREALEHLGRPRRAVAVLRPHRGERRRAGRQRGRSAEGPRHSRTGGGREIEARSERVLRHDRAVVEERTRTMKIVATTLARSALDNRHSWGAVAWIDGKTYVAPTCELDVLRPRRRRRRFRGGLLLRPAERRTAGRVGEARLGARRTGHHVPRRHHDGDAGAGAGLCEGRLRAYTALNGTRRDYMRRRSRTAGRAERWIPDRRAFTSERPDRRGCRSPLGQ